ncbi:MAG: hypothetical protein JNL88_09355 [Bacteroidia bacterium]|nr:hypothetical protein [Bacteroidia bacterium]
MKKIFLAAAFVTLCSVGSAIAQTGVNSEKAAVTTDVQQKETAKPAAKASCCSKKSTADAKSCSSKEEKAAGKSSCCQKGGHGHADAKAEGTEEKQKN